MIRVFVQYALMCVRSKMLNYIDLRQPISFYWHRWHWHVSPCLRSAKRKLPVSGSDIRPSHITQRLETLEAHIFATQDASNLEFF